MEAAATVHPLKRARQALDVGQAQVAKAAGCSVSLISMCEHGYHPGPATKQAIARAVSSTVEALWP